MKAFAVINEHTLAVLPWPSCSKTIQHIHTLGVNLHRHPSPTGSTDGFYLKGIDKVRPATLGDFADYRVQVPADFVQPSAASEIDCLKPRWTQRFSLRQFERLQSVYAKPIPWLPSAGQRLRIIRLGCA
jgi:hypothetical protein